MVKKTLNIGEEYETKVNYRKLLNDIREAYPHDALETLIVETFANSLDAEAEHIEITVDPETYRILDDGKGMTRYEFKEYHNIASMTKERGSGGIGFAGVGAKIYLDKARYIYTETRSRRFYGASEWQFLGEIPKWKVVAPKGRVPGRTGTFVETKLGSEDAGRMTKKFVIECLRRNYNAVLLGWYGKKDVRVNGTPITAWKPEKIEERYERPSAWIGRNRARILFVKANGEIPEDFRGVSIVVYGKTVVSGEWFNQYALSADKIHGMVKADFLINAINTSKTQINKTSSKWQRLRVEVGRILSDWLEDIGDKVTPPKVSSEIKRMTNEIEKSINRVILGSPELIDLANKFFQSIRKRKTAIKSSGGELRGREVEGMQRVPGTIGGSTLGHGVPTVGPEDGTGIVEDADGNVEVTRVTRGMRAGIKISFSERINDPNEGFLDVATRTIMINTAHPAYKIACGLSVGRRRLAWHYHVLRTTVRTITREAAASEEEAKEFESKILTRWFDSFIDSSLKRQIEKIFPK